MGVSASVLDAAEFRKRFEFGTHEFPLLSHRGEQVANEFQMIHPENIQFASPRVRGGEGYTIEKITPTVIDSGDEVSVTFSAVTPSKMDWIGAYSPADVDITSTVPVKYGWCSDSPNYLSGGSGMLTFNMTNLRADIAFYYFTNSTHYPINVGKSSQTVTFNNFNQPLRPRVVATGDPNILSLLWSSATSKKPKLSWGVKSGHYTHHVYADTKSYTRESMCGAPATTIGYRDLGLVHTANFDGMLALSSKKVYYRFGDEATSDYSQEFVLQVPPRAGTQPEGRPTTVILFDDLGRGTTDMTYTWNEYGRPSINTTMSVGPQVARGEIDAIYHGGDISYATGYLAVWDFYLDMLTPMASGTLYLSTVGNHETDWVNSPSYYNVTDSGGECGVATTTLLPMPAPATTNEPWWSYDVGLIHFIGISTEHDYRIGSKQYNWLEKDLKSIDRSKTPWVIFGGHRAMYINSNYSGPATSDISAMDLMIDNLDALLFKYRVNIGFYGHNHVVQRHSAVYNRTLVQKSVPQVDPVTGITTNYQYDPQATCHWIVGTGGAAFTVNAMAPGQGQPEWNEMYFYRWGYAKVVAVNATYLTWDWIDNSNNEVVDRNVYIQSTDFSKPWRSA